MKYIFFSSVLIIHLGLTSCDSIGAKTPEKVSMEYAQALYNADFKAAQELATENTSEFLDMFKMLGSEANAQGTMGINSPKSASCEDSGEGKKLCKVCCDSQGKEVSYDLVNIEGRWLVDQTLSNVHEELGKIPMDSFPDFDTLQLGK